MSIRLFSIALTLLAIGGSSVFAQGDFFWSTFDLNSGATNSAANVNLNVGDTGSLYLYYSIANSELDSAAGLDLSFTNNGILNFTAAETFNFDISIGGVAVSDRWASTADNGDPQGGFFGAAGAVGPDTVTALNAFTVTDGDGLIAANTGPARLDEGYDTAAEAFLFARVDYVAVADGSTSINTAAGAIGIINGDVGVDASFGAANITVAVPEPTSAALLAVGMVGLVVRRRR